MGVNGILSDTRWGLMGYWGWMLMEILGLEVNGTLEDTGLGIRRDTGRHWAGCKGLTGNSGLGVTESTGLELVRNTGWH